MARWTVTKAAEQLRCMEEVALEGSLRDGWHSFSWKILNRAYAGLFLQTSYLARNSTLIMLTCITICTLYVCVYVCVCVCVCRCVCEYIVTCILDAFQPIKWNKTKLWLKTQRNAKDSVESLRGLWPVPLCCVMIMRDAICLRQSVSGCEEPLNCAPCPHTHSNKSKDLYIEKGVVVNLCFHILQPLRMS